MFKLRLHVLPVALAVICLATMPAFGDLDLEGKTVTNVFLSTDLAQALSDISQQVDVPILVGSDVEGTVSIELDETPLPKALSMLLASGGYVWREMDGYVLVGSSDTESPLFAGLSETRRIKLSNTSAEEALNMLSPALRKYVTADAQLNRLVVTAPPPIADRIADDIVDIDEPAQHVLLEARVVVLERDALLDLGVEWDFPTVQTGTVNLDVLNQDFPWAISVGMTPGLQFSNSLMLALNFLEQNEEASIVSHPQLTVRDGQQANMGVITEEYFQIETQESIDLEVIDSGTRLSILPRIGDNGKVTLTMDIEVSDVVGRSQSDAAGDNLPVVTRRTAQSTVQIVSGGTAAISGLMESRTDILNRQVPGASDLPLIGGGFNNDASARSSKQLAVFITATIVEQPSPRQPSEVSYPPVDEEAFRAELRAVLAADHPEQEGTHP